MATLASADQLILLCAAGRLHQATGFQEDPAALLQ
jgi:hypothetical protein